MVRKKSTDVKSGERVGHSTNPGRPACLSIYYPKRPVMKPHVRGSNSWLSNIPIFMTGRQKCNILVQLNLKKRIINHLDSVASGIG